MNNILEDIKNDKLINKYLYKYTWLSGSSTPVYPIEIYKDKEVWKEIRIQINTNKNVFNKLIERYKNKYKEIEHILFFKSDGSCPAVLMFKLNEV